MPMVDPGDPQLVVASLRAEHERHYGTPPEVVGRAPGRVNLMGEHTDYNRGLVLPVALAHATWASAGRRDDGRLRLTSRQSDTTWEGHLDDVSPGAVGGWPAYAAGTVWAMREQGIPVSGADVLIDSTVPLGAGLSSSAALECAVAVAVAALAGHDLDDDARRGLVAASVRAETEVVGAPTGGMDQAVAMLAEPGGALLVDFERDLGAAGASQAVPLALAAADLALLVTDTRVSHALVDGGYGDRREECERAATALGAGSLREVGADDVDRLEDPVLRRRARHVVSETARVPQVVAAVDSGDWAEVGRLFAASHVSMRDDFEISCPELDTAVATAVEVGALGARMTGGGFGGSAVALVPVERVDAVTRAVDAAFVKAGHRSPAHLLAVPSGAADVV